MSKNRKSFQKSHKNGQKIFLFFQKSHFTVKKHIEPIVNTRELCWKNLKHGKLKNEKLSMLEKWTNEKNGTLKHGKT